MQNLNVSLLHACADIAPDYDTRYYLNGVLVEIQHGRIQYTGCNGHALFTAWHKAKTAEAPPVILPRKAVIEAVKAKGETLVFGRLEHDRYELGDRIVTPINGTFPDCRRVIPAQVSGEAANFNPALFWKMRRAFNRAMGIGVNSETHAGNCEVLHNGDSAAVFLSHDHPNMLGILMPWNLKKRSGPVETVLADRLEGAQAPTLPAKAA